MEDLVIMTRKEYFDKMAAAVCLGRKLGEYFDGKGNLDCNLIGVHFAEKAKSGVLEQVDQILREAKQNE